MIPIKMNTLKKLIYLFTILLFFNCTKEEPKDYLKFSKNALNYQITPTDKFDKSGLMFSDQGAWFAYSFPNLESKISGFSGPFLMTQQNGIWSSASLTNLVIENNSWTSHTTSSFNSYLEQTFTSDKLKLKKELIFASGHTAMIKLTIKNISKSNQQLQYHFKNEKILADGLQFSSNNNQLIINSTKTDAIGHLILPKEINIKSTDSTYVSDKISIELKPNEVKELTISQTFIFKEYSWNDELKAIQKTNFKTD